jgi:glycine/D-amino acid oxidase-like deaminating enzyme
MVAKRIAVLGGGLIGLATAYKLLLRYPGLDVQLYEKEAGTRDTTNLAGTVEYCTAAYTMSPGRSRPNSRLKESEK